MKRSNQSGFTLVELIITVVILGILLGIAVPNFIAMIMNMQIKTATEALNNGLQLARAEAVRRNNNVRFVFGTSSGWTVGCETVVADTNADGVDDCPAVIQSRSSGEGSSSATVAVTPAGAATVTFNGLGRVTANSDASSSITQIDVDVSSDRLSSNQSRDLRLLISGGSIRMCDPNISTVGNPRKC